MTRTAGNPGEHVGGEHGTTAAAPGPQASPPA
jgi:hypothetical protein